MKSLLLAISTSLFLLFTPAAFALTCDDYSQSCETPGPTIVTPQPSDGKTVTTLPHTGFTYGDVVLLGFGLAGLGSMIVVATRTKK